MGLGVVEGTSVKLREREERRGEKGTTSESDRLIGERRRDDGEHEGRERDAGSIRAESKETTRIGMYELESHAMHGERRIYRVNVSAEYSRIQLPFYEKLDLFIKRHLRRLRRQSFVKRLGFFIEELNSQRSRV